VICGPTALQNCCGVLGFANPFPDQWLTSWFHSRLTPTFVSVLRAFSALGCGEWIGVVVFALALLFAWKRWWPSLVTLIVAVPGGMLLNEWVKMLVHRQRPFVNGPFVDWSGYSFASGHTIGATLLYGQLMVFILPSLKTRHWRLLSIFSAIALVFLVGFSRIALGAHFLSDVLAGMAFGITWLVLCMVAARSMRRRSLPSQAALLLKVNEAAPAAVAQMAQRDSQL
jgi:membrane-associated phospholipid phosphatase